MVFFLKANQLTVIKNSPMKAETNFTSSIKSILDQVSKE